MDIKKITTDPNKKIEPENAIWSNFVCKATILGEEIANLESNINQISDHQKTPFFNFSDSLKGIDRVICLPFSLTLKHKINLEARVNLISLLRNHEKTTPQHEFSTRDEWVAEIKRKAYSDLDKQPFRDIDNILTDLANDMLVISEPSSSDITALELRFQATVSLWSCLETLIKDHLINNINTNPLLAIKINSDEKLRKEIGLDKIDFSHLIENNFNLQNKIGTIIFSNQNSGKIGNLKSILKSIYPNEIFPETLDKGIIFQLHLRRNLIVHYRGTIDQEFQNRSNSNLNIGDKINITPGELISGFRAVTKFGNEILEAFLKSTLKD